MFEITPEALLVLIARGALNDLTPEQLAARRESMVEVRNNLERGITLPPFKTTTQLRARPSRAKSTRSYLTPEERVQARRDTAARCRVQAQAEIKAGTRQAPVTSPRSRARLDLPVGKWITFRTRAGLDRTVRILAAVPAGMVPPIPPGSDLKHLAGEAQPSRMPRYLLAMPALDAVLRPPVILAWAVELEPNILVVHEGTPEHLTGRLALPLSRGTPAQWESRGGGGSRIRDGKVLAYIPAGQSAAALVRLRSSFNNVDISVRDRYLMSTGKTIALPPAYVVERPLINQPKKDAA